MNLLSDQVDSLEIEIILAELEKTKLVSGDIVEFGCYIGTTSVFLAKHIDSWQDKKLWLFDSFEGLPEKSSQDRSSLGDLFKKGELLATKKQLILNLKKCNLTNFPKIKKGWFNELVESDIPDKISFAFLDGDYYDSIMSPLRLIWDRLEDGAVIVVDDYGNPALPGAKIAVDEWCEKYGLKLTHKHSLAIFQK